MAAAIPTMTIAQRVSTSVKPWMVRVLRSAVRGGESPAMRVERAMVVSSRQLAVRDADPDPWLCVPRLLGVCPLRETHSRLRSGIASFIPASEAGDANRWGD